MKTKCVAVLTLMLMFVFTTSMAAQDVAAAKSVYTSKCSICHGPDGHGNTSIGKNLKIKDFHSPDVQQTSDSDLKLIIMNGKNKMPSFKGKLSDAQIDELIAYVRQLGK
jgi:cytochrome c6